MIKDIIYISDPEKEKYKFVVTKVKEDNESN